MSLLDHERRPVTGAEISNPANDPHEILTRIRSMLEREAGTENTTLRDVASGNGETALEILISTILSQRTRDENTRRASSALFKTYRNARDLAEGDLESIEQLIRPAGFYKVKARKIKEAASIISQKYGGKVPERLEELLLLPGVGRKTANCVLVYAFGKPAIPVDTHVHRVSNRIGLVETRTPEQTEMRLKEIIDKRDWLDLNELFVRFGQEICKPIRPRCPKCDLKTACKYYSEAASQTSTSRPRISRKMGGEPKYP
jgi:endonuclease-3